MARLPGDKPCTAGGVTLGVSVGTGDGVGDTVGVGVGVAVGVGVGVTVGVAVGVAVGTGDADTGIRLAPVAKLNTAVAGFTMFGK